MADQPDTPLRGDAPGLALAADVRAAGRAVGLITTTARLVLAHRLAPGAGPAALAARARRTARRLLDLHGVDVGSAGRPPSAPAVLVTNHVSYLDPLAVASVVPCIAIAKRDTLDWPLIGGGLRALGVLFVRRGDAHSGAVALRRALRALGAGATVLNFPEGTTGEGRTLGGFRRGVFGLARIARVPIVPGHVSYDDPRVHWFGAAPFAPHYWRLSRNPRVGALVRFGEPLAARADEDAASLAARARAAVDALGRHSR